MRGCDTNNCYKIFIEDTEIPWDTPGVANMGESTTLYLNLYTKIPYILRSGVREYGGVKQIDFFL